MDRSFRPIAFALGALGVFAVLFVIGGATGWWSAAENEQGIGEISRWCERVGGGMLREPINTLGNLGFVVSGLAMFVVLARDTREAKPLTNRFIGNQPIALLYASTAVFLGPGSMVMHGSHTFFGAWIDNLSMVAYILIPWVFNLAILGRWRDRAFFWVYGSVLGLYAVAYWVFGSDLGIGLDLFGVSIALWIISEIIYRHWSGGLRWWSGLIGFAIAFTFEITPADMIEDPASYWWVVLFWLPALLSTSPPTTRRTYTPWFWAGLVSFLVAYAIWTTGTDEHSWCRPESFIQAHAIWHLLTAVSTWCFFKFLRTDRNLASESRDDRDASDESPKQIKTRPARRR
ncbi:MAG: ceramidase domain-containing protein [Actinomycetota bacterium]|nr:ceramidase domain-containing protein [Actinomycetota bacterium]